MLVTQNMDKIYVQLNKAKQGVHYEVVLEFFPFEEILLCVRSAQI